MPTGNRGEVSLGRYEILAELGRGGMGVVYQAHDPTINRLVAIKTVSVAALEGDEEAEYRERFFREAQAAGRLSHPRIVTIFDVGEEGTTRSPYIVMEYVAGQSLKKMLSAAPQGLPCDTALRLIEELADALGYAHGQGVVHRDIKPANIIVTEDGHAKITDFGIAKMDLTTATNAGELLGTPAYMSPEQLRGAAVDGRSDLFSLGVVLYALLTGHRPFQGDGNSTVQFKVIHRAPLPAATYNIALPLQVDAILSRAMAKDPSQRYQTGAEMAASVRQVRQQLRLGQNPMPAHMVANTSHLAGAGASQPARASSGVPATAGVKARLLLRGWRVSARAHLSQFWRTDSVLRQIRQLQEPCVRSAQAWREKCTEAVRGLLTTTRPISPRWYFAVLGSVLFIAGLSVLGAHHRASGETAARTTQAALAMPNGTGTTNGPGMPVGVVTPTKPVTQKLASGSSTSGQTHSQPQPAMNAAAHVTGAKKHSPSVGSTADLSKMGSNSMASASGLEAETSAAPQVTKPVAFIPAPTRVAPATLELGVEHQLAEGTMTVWIDGAKVYSDTFQGDVKKRLGIFRKIRGEFAHELTVSAGKHRVRVRVQSADEKYDQSKAVAGNFPENGKLVLNIKCEKNKDMQLALD